MNDGDVSAGFSREKLIDSLGDQFEEAWIAGERPQLESYLQRVPESARSALVAGLLGVELEYRRGFGEQPELEGYLVRFSDHEAEVRSAFARLVSGDATEDFVNSITWQPGHDPLPGYRLIGLLGEGGMGEVWEARGPGNVPIALKRVNLNDRCGKTELTALELLKSIRHPHLLSIHGYWIRGPLLIIGCELADESLKSLLGREANDASQGLPPDRVAPYLADAAEALDYLVRPIHRVNSHAVRIQHRDVKPANLLLQGGAVKVADFGLAKMLDHVVESRSTSMTMAYAPPEFFRGETTSQSDQYSLGVTYYELRTGCVPFRGTAAEIMDGHLNRDPDLSGLGETERRVVARSLAKNPDHRWAGCVKFIGEVMRAHEPASIGQTRAIVDQDEEPAVETTFRGELVTTGLLLVDEELIPLPLQRTDARVAVTAATADVAVTQMFINTHDRALEATYVFPLPEDAAVHSLRIHVDNRIIEGVVCENREARQTYQEAKTEGHGATLIEQTTDGVFTVSVANILPGQEIRVEIAYLQPLPFRDGQYRLVFPMAVSPRYILGSDPTAETIVDGVPAPTTDARLPRGMLRGDVVGIEIDLDAGVPLCGFDSPSHDIVVTEETGTSRVKIALCRADEIPNRDFVLNYRVTGAKIEHVLLCEPPQEDEAGTWMLLTTPPAEQFVLSKRKEVVFVLDSSAAMEGAPLWQAKEVVRQLLEHLETEDAFNVIAFSSQVKSLAAMPMSAEEKNLQRAQAFLEGLRAERGTEMLEPLRLALQQRRSSEDRYRLVVLLTQGSVIGERELLAALRPDIGNSRIVVFGIGAAINRRFVTMLADAGRGFAEFLYPGEDVTRVVGRAVRRTGRAALLDVQLDWQGETEAIFPEQCPDLYCDMPLLVMGRYRGESPPQLAVRGQLAGRDYEATIVPTELRQHEGRVSLRTLWARQRLEALAERIREHPEQMEELRTEIVELAIKHRLASAYTSFLAVEYRSAVEREKAIAAASVTIPQYTPDDLSSLLDRAIAATPPETDDFQEAIGGLIQESVRETVPAREGVESVQRKLSRIRTPRGQSTPSAEGSSADRPTWGAPRRRSQIVRGILGVCLTGGAIGILSEAAQDSSGEAFRTIGIVAGTLLLMTGVVLVGPVVKSFSKRLRDKQ